MCFKFCITTLAFSIFVDIVDTFWKILKKLSRKFNMFYAQIQHSGKNLKYIVHFSNILNAHHIETSERFITSEKDKQSRKQLLSARTIV